MAPQKPIIAIVGRPNVGKSCMFNRIVGKRVAVVDDVPGVTRDRNYVETRWNNTAFVITDTGGLMPGSDEPIAKEVRIQVEMAVNEAAVVLFLCDAQTGPADIDLEVARLLRKKAPGKVILVANKAESNEAIYNVPAFNKLGLGEPFPASALHGTNVGNLLEAAITIIKKNPQPTVIDDSPLPVRIAVIGRPNAGKSSLVNKLLHKQRMIVNDVPGTTRDSIDSRLVYNDQPFVLIDTAGLRKKGRVGKVGVEYHCNQRAIESISRADVCALMVDTNAGFGEQDLKILEQIISEHKGVLLVFNKWDLIEKGDKTFDHMVADLRRLYTELQNIPCVSISALTGQRVTVVLETAKKIKDDMRIKIPTAEFRQQLFRWLREKPHPITANSEVRILGGKQAGSTYPLFVLFATNPHEINKSYIRYLENRIHLQFGFMGCPVVLTFKKATRPSHKKHLAEAG